MGCRVELGLDVERVKAEVREGDVVVVFSKGGFDGIHGELLEGL